LYNIYNFYLIICNLSQSHMITYISVKEFNQVSQMKCRTHAFLHIADVFLRNKNRLVLILLDTCSYIDRLGSVDSPRPRNHPFGDGSEIQSSFPLYLRRPSIRVKSFLASGKEFPSYRGNAPSLHVICVLSADLESGPNIELHKTTLC